MPTANGINTLEVAFTTWAGQSYIIVTLQSQIEEGELVISRDDVLASNIICTNGSTYHYITGLPGGLELSDLAV